jgi:hypothetical protein
VVNVQVYEARAQWSEGWWIVRIPELELVTQADESDEIEWMARDVIATMLELDVADVGVRVSFE